MTSLKTKNNDYNTEDYYYREKEMIKIESFINMLKKGSANDVIITGKKGVGKTTLLKQINEDKEVIKILINCSDLFIINKGKIDFIDFLEFFIENMMESFANYMDINLNLNELYEVLDFNSLNKKQNKTIDEEENKFHDGQLKFDFSKESSDLELKAGFNFEFKSICKKLGFPLEKNTIPLENKDKLNKDKLNELDSFLNLERKIAEYQNKRTSQINEFNNDCEKNRIDYLIKFILKFSEKFYIHYLNKIKGILIIIDDFQLINDINSSNEVFSLLKKIDENKGNIMTILSTTTPYSEIINYKSKNEENNFLINLIPFKISPFTELELSLYLLDKHPNINFTKKGFELFYNITKGYPSHVNNFINILNFKNTYNDISILNNFKENINQIAFDWILIWSTLSSSEKEIITILIEYGPIRWTNLLENADFSRATMNKYLDLLVKKSIVIKRKNMYYIEDPILISWLSSIKKELGTYPIYYI